MVYSLFLLAHVIGLVLFAGTTIVQFFMTSAFLKSAGSDLERAKFILGLSGKFSRLTGIGAAVLILSGIAMVANTQGVIAEALWFRIKFTLVILAIINGVVFGRIVGVKMGKVVAGDGSTALLALKPQYQLFYTLQFVLLAGIVSLGVLKAF